MDITNKKMNLWVDPPEGWKYGFPKNIDEEYLQMGKDKTEWFIKNGYPVELIDKGMLNYCRMGFYEITD